MGCGTSVLSILAEKLGSTEITAIDNDDWAIENSIENIHSNNCKHISVFKDDATYQGLFDVILSNINRNINLEMLLKYAESLNKGGKILLSGFYSHDISDFEETMKNLNLKISSQKIRNSWACIVVEAC